MTDENNPHLLPGKASAVTAQPKRGFDRWWILVAIVASLIIYLITARPDPFRRMLVFIADGVRVTMLVTVTSFLFVMVLGLIAGLGRLSKNPVISTIASVYVEVVRGIPLLVQIFAWYFAFPSIIQSIGAKYHIASFENYLANPVGMAILGITFCYGAYMSEIYRAGIQSIARGQMEAARSLGMTHFQAMRYIIIPQAVRVILPPVGNEFVSMLKDSSLVSAVAVADLTRRGREFISQNFIPIEGWTLVALVYLMMTLFATRIVTWVERKTRIVR